MISVTIDDTRTARHIPPSAINALIISHVRSKRKINSRFYEIRSRNSVYSYNDLSLDRFINFRVDHFI